MRILTVRQPWASLIVAGVKDIENRTWTTPYRGLIAILASRGRPAPFHGSGAVKTLPRGVILGVVTLADIVETHSSEWFEGPYGWRLTDAREFVTPIPYMGQLGLPRASNELIERIHAALARSKRVGARDAGRVHNRLWP